MKKICPKIKVIGIEPVKKLREIAYSQGISKEELIDGDATKLNFRNSEFVQLLAMSCHSSPGEEVERLLNRIVMLHAESQIKFAIRCPSSCCRDKVPKGTSRD